MREGDNALRNFGLERRRGSNSLKFLV